MTDRAPLPYDFMPAVPSFELRSDDVADGQMMSQNQVFDGFGMTGRNISPSLSWSGFPAQTKNFAVTLFDPDAPTGSGWWHWVVLGIPASVTKLEAGAAGTGGSGLPEGAFHVRNDYMVKDSAVPRRRKETRRTGTCARRGVAGRQRRDLTGVCQAKSVPGSCMTPARPGTKRRTHRCLPVLPPQ
jgi:phosphatidylethanolamine-binding protein (PEBP) family uncharacterized protein